MKNNVVYKVLGVMSGTSLDGIDLALCKFTKCDIWSYEIKKCKTVKYDNNWISILNNLQKQNENKIEEINIKYAELVSHKINSFLNNKKVDFISSHGHTIFHQPEKKITLQIGDGATINNLTGIKTINNFRSLDISLNGQGAPLVPVGDLKLFPQYKYCVNLGGFANISIKNKSIIAFDICPCNIVLNKICNSLNILFDKKGEIAREGVIIKELLDSLNNMKYYKKRPPKSLGREWVEKNIYPILNKYKIKDQLRTMCEHIALQVSKHNIGGKTLYTGGGVLNNFLMERIKFHSKSKLIIPDHKLINFKEALIFGFLGVLRYRNEVNCLKSVTGADRDNCGGIIHD